MGNFSFADKYHRIKTLDMHTGGEPLRIVLEGLPKFSKMSILQIRNELKQNFDHYRKAIMWEPRGHADMYGLLKVPAEKPDSDFGVIFMHNEGYSTMCGHATIAIAKAAVQLGWVIPTPPKTSIKIDAPCGQLTAFVDHNDKEIFSTSFENVPSFHLGTFHIAIPGLGSIEYDLAYGGAYYAYLDIGQLAISCNSEYYSEHIRLGKLIKKSIIDSRQAISHPFEPDLGFLYGVIFTERSAKPGIHSKNICVFADGEVDRCATGSGVSGRAAILHAKNQLGLHQTIRIESIIGTTLDVEIVKKLAYGPYEAIIPKVYGDAYYTGFHEFWIDPEDPLKDGFLLR